MTALCLLHDARVAPRVEAIIRDHAKVRHCMYGEDEETVKELIEEIVERSTITLMHLRPISTLPVEDQVTVINAMPDAFIEGGTVSTRQVAAMVKEIRDKVWGEEAHTFTCAKGREADRVKIAYSKSNRSRPTGYGKACTRAEQASTTVTAEAKREEVKTE